MWYVFHMVDIGLKTNTVPWFYVVGKNLTFLCRTSGCKKLCRKNCVGSQQRPFKTLAHLREPATYMVSLSQAKNITSSGKTIGRNM